MGQSGWIESGVRGGGSCHGQKSVQGASWAALGPCTWAEGCTPPGRRVCQCCTAGGAARDATTRGSRMGQMWLSETRRLLPQVRSEAAATCCREGSARQTGSCACLFRVRLFWGLETDRLALSAGLCVQGLRPPVSHADEPRRCCSVGRAFCARPSRRRTGSVGTQTPCRRSVQGAGPRGASRPCAAARSGVGSVVHEVPIHLCPVLLWGPGPSPTLLLPYAAGAWTWCWMAFSSSPLVET